MLKLVIVTVTGIHFQMLLSSTYITIVIAISSSRLKHQYLTGIGAIKGDHFCESITIHPTHIQIYIGTAIVVEFNQRFGALAAADACVVDEDLDRAPS